MHIEQIKIENFRILKNCTLDMRDKTTLLVGRNNTGKTSLAVVLEKFLSQSASFTYADFPLSARKALADLDKDTNVDALSIRLVLKIRYTEDDNLEALSEFMLDLDPARRHVNILLECQIDQKKLLRNLPDDRDKRKKFLEDNLGPNFLDTAIYAFDESEYAGEEPYYLAERSQLEEKDKSDLLRFLSFQVIHARRNVASSEDGGQAKPLSTISTKIFKKIDNATKIVGYDDPHGGADEERKTFDELRAFLAQMDDELKGKYDNVFCEFLKSSRDFLNLEDIKIVSNIQSQRLVENSSHVIYGDEENYLPENHNGLGYLNILYLLLQIELCKDEFNRRKAPINLLVMEEPEAHTHPQIQYVFADKIHDLVSQVQNLQAILTTHSSHIVAKSDFEDIRYLKKEEDNNISIKNFHTELKAEYEELGDEGEQLFKFLKQYLTINSAELFFSSKVIFIEGTTERMLLPWFIQVHDQNVKDARLSSENITVLEVGANAKAFSPFLKFIGVTTLVITDIDTTKERVNPDTEKVSYRAHRVKESTHTSNESLKFFLSAPKNGNKEGYEAWHRQLIEGKLSCKDKGLKIAYQLEENGYHARSFEDAFISINIEKIKQNDNLYGLKNLKELDKDEPHDFYDLTEKILAKKSDFAASILYSALLEDENWQVPQYIKAGLEWIHQN